MMILGFLLRAMIRYSMLINEYSEAYTLESYLAPYTSLVVNLPCTLFAFNVSVPCSLYHASQGFRHPAS